MHEEDLLFADGISGMCRVHILPGNFVTPSSVQIGSLIEQLAKKHLGEGALQEIENETEEEQKGGKDVIGKLRVNLIAAKGLPKMEMFRCFPPEVLGRVPRRSRFLYSMS